MKARRTRFRLTRLAVPVIALFLALPGRAQDEGWDDWGDGDWEDPGRGLQWHGFVEGALGSRWQRHPRLGDRQTLGDLRLRVETTWESDAPAFDSMVFDFRGEAWYDDYLGSVEGELRDLTFAFSPASSLDLKLGRQVLTWGTGDLVFLNDLFPKDWVSFFAGREDEYLKAPSNAVRATWYTKAVNVDAVWTPVFEPDTYLTGERFPFFFPPAGRQIAPHPPFGAVEPDRQLENGEIALRLFRNVRGAEYALYGYRGFFKQPTALNSALEPTFAPLSAVGASFRRALFSGLINSEASYYLSRDDRRGSDPRVPNDQLRFLLGYERQAIANLTLAFQYYLEWTLDHDRLLANDPDPRFAPDERRHVLTSRVTWLAQRDKLTLSLFSFYSPSDDDYYLRPSVAYRYSDRWSFSGGANVFGGDESHTFFGQHEDNSNLYVRIRFNY